MAVAAATLATTSAYARGFEHVSPHDAGGYDAPSYGETFQNPVLSDDGTLYYTVGGPGTTDSPDGFLDGAAVDAFRAVPTLGGWTHDWLSPYCPGQPQRPLPGDPCAAQANLSVQAAGGDRVVVRTTEKIDPLDTNNVLNIYVGTSTGMRLVDRTPDGVAAAPAASASHGIVASEDARRIAFASRAALLPADTDLGLDVYVEIDGALHLVTEAGTCGTSSCIPSSGADPSIRMSHDGQRIVFSTTESLAASDGDSTANLYVWDDGVRRQLDAGADSAPILRGLAADGSRAVFLTSAALDPNDGDALTDIYVSDTSTGAARLVSEDTASLGLTFSAMSADGSTVLFTTAEALVGAPDTGAPNLYAWDEENGVRHVTALPVDDSIASNASAGRQIRVSNDGAVVVFSTRGDLLPSEDGNDVADVYRWQGGQLSLLTPRNGEPPLRDARIGGYFGTLALATNQTVLGRAITGDGDKAFFTTESSLLPEDTDGGANDIYQWEETGLSLVSPGGAIDAHAQYIDNSNDGSKAFFATSETILGTDADSGQVDIYASVVDGGLPAGTGVGQSDGSDLGKERGAAPPVPLPELSSLGSATPKPGNRPARPALRIGKLSINAKRLLRRGGVRVRVSVPGAGRARAAVTTSRRLVLARGSRRFSTRRADGLIRLRLTRAGARRLRQTRPARVVIRVTFVTRDGRAMTDRSRATFKGPGRG